MAVEVQPLSCKKIMFKPFSFPQKTQHELALDDFHQWLNECYKKVYYNSKKMVYRIEYIFPDKKIIEEYQKPISLSKIPK